MTDDRPLERIFHPEKITSQIVTTRIQRWVLILAANTYSIQYKEESQNSNADALSRLPLPDTPTSMPVPGKTISLMELLENTPVSAEETKQWTRESPVLGIVFNFIKQGGPTKCLDPDLQLCFQRRDELSVQDDSFLWGNRVVVPPQGRGQVFDELHDTHPGISKLKSLARSYVWRPNMDSTLKNKVQTCNHCQMQKKYPPEAPLYRVNGLVDRGRELIFTTRAHFSEQCS